LSLLKRVCKILLPAIILAGILASCKYEPDSLGDFEKIYVFADSVLYGQVRTDLEQVFDNYVYTPHAERSFYLEYHPIDDLAAYERRRNLLFLTILGKEDPVSAYIENALSADVEEAIRSGRIFEIFQEDFYARDQMVIILPGVNVESLRKNIQNQKDRIYKKLEDYYFARLEKIMFLKGEQKAIEEYLADNLGWYIRLQHDYSIVKESKESDFIWFRRFKPDRNLFVYRFKADSLPESSDWLVQLRDSLSVVHFESDKIEREDTYMVKTTFRDLPAVNMIGVWQNHGLLIGGPFKTFAFFDPASGFIYILDFMVTAPGERKKPFMDQLEVMARSFRFAS